MTTTISRTLSGRTVWITGAGRGLGLAMARAVGRAGARVALSARSVEQLEKAAAELEADGVQAQVHPLSVEDSDAVRATAHRIVEQTGRLDGLVNCAGISPSFLRSERVPDADWTRILDVNLTGTFRCCREAGTIMLDAGGGSIVNISSVHATSGFERLAAYSASKGAIEALTRTLAVEWADRGVRVNAIAPGYFTTELSTPLLESRHWSDRVVPRIPLGRVGDPAELGGSIVYLLGDQSSYTTGTTMSVDGGWTAW